MTQIDALSYVQLIELISVYSRGFVPVPGFSPRKGSLVIYAAEGPDRRALLKKLGKHKGGDRQCLYINKLADVDLEVLETLIRSGLTAIKKAWPVTAS